MATTSLIRTPSSTGNRKTFTFSCWFKKASIGAIGNLFSQYAGSGSGADKHFRVRFNTNDTIGVAAFSTDVLVTNRVFKDTSAWYHLTLAVDTTQATDSNRVKLYINGTQETSFSSTSYPSQNYDYAVNTASYPIRIGADDSDGNGPYGWFDGLMTHVHLADGTAYAASTFGSTDATTGEWKISTSPTFTPGTNGFTILKDGNTITDQSANSNNFTLVGGTLTNTEDNPSNCFAVFNRTDRHPGTTNNYGDYLTYLGTKITIASAQKGCLRSTIGVTSGKYYWEAKVISKSKGFYGVCNSTAFDITSASLQSATSYSGLWYYENGPSYYSYNNSTNNTSIASVANNDILGFALDMDNYAFYIHKNGTYMNSGSPTSGGSRTGSIAELFTYGRNVLSDKGEVFVNHFNDSGSGGSTVEYNFGNGYFGVTAISSEGSNASGIGKFEYDVPAGYTALSTKGLNE